VSEAFIANEFEDKEYEYNQELDFKNSSEAARILVTRIGDEYNEVRVQPVPDSKPVIAFVMYTKSFFDPQKVTIHELKIRIDNFKEISEIKQKENLPHIPVYLCDLNTHFYIEIKEQTQAASASSSSE